MLWMFYYRCSFQSRKSGLRMILPLNQARERSWDAWDPALEPSLPGPGQPHKRAVCWPVCVCKMKDPTGVGGWWRSPSLSPQGESKACKGLWEALFPSPSHQAWCSSQKTEGNVLPERDQCSKLCIQVEKSMFQLSEAGTQREVINPGSIRVFIHAIVHHPCVMPGMGRNSQG